MTAAYPRPQQSSGSAGGSGRQRASLAAPAPGCLLGSPGFVTPSGDDDEYPEDQHDPRPIDWEELGRQMDSSVSFGEARRIAQIDFLNALSGEFRPVRSNSQHFVPGDVVRFKYPRGDRKGEDRAVRVRRFEFEGLPFDQWKVMSWDPSAAGVGAIGADRTHFRHLMTDLFIHVPSSPLLQLEDGGASAAADRSASFRSLSCDSDAAVEPLNDSEVHDKFVALVAGAQRTVKTTQYTFDDMGAVRAYRDAVERGVDVRVIFDGG